jgi:hypothetical protein
MSDGYIQITVDGVPSGQLILTKKDAPDALVEVRVNHETINVKSELLSIAVETITGT